MHWLPALAVEGHAAAYTCISALVIISAIIAAGASSNKHYNNATTTKTTTNSYADAHSDKRPDAFNLLPASSPLATTTAAALMTSENVISTPSNFNKTPLQQQQDEQAEQQLLLLPPATQSAAAAAAAEHLFTANNKRNSLPLGHGDEDTSAVISIDATTATGNNNGRTADTNTASSSATTDDARNGFYDKINISNQRNEFNGRRCPQTTTASAKTTTITAITATATATETGAATQTATAARLKRDKNAESSFFESVELQESLSQHGQQQQQQQEQQQTRTRQQQPQQPQQQQQQLLLLHRQKRYLVFPESSSFQLIFDLIIPIVDYTNFAIMGITCAVAWELPSKPPSEIIENFHDKLNEGTFGYSRRNDSTQQHINYIDRNGASGGSPAPATVTIASSATPNSYYHGQPNNKPYAATAAATAATAAGLPSAASAYYTPRPRNYFEAVPPHPPTLYSYYSGDQSRGTTLPVYAGAGANAGRGRDASFEAQRTKPFSKYYKKANGFSDTSDFASIDKHHFIADWQRRVPGQRHYQQSRPKPHAGAWADGDDWWEQNKQRVQHNWRAKQHQWTKYDYNKPKVPVTTYAGPVPVPAPAPAAPATMPSFTASDRSAPSSTSDARTGRTRKILQAPPQHRIYPVFGKRRRRRSRRWTTDLDAFELKLEQIHLREHLQTRQKLYGKIEKLYKVRGHNGTACVLRALCETGQRAPHQQQQQQQQQQEAHQHQGEPQSFITELLRAIFSLPTDSSTDEAKLQYMDAHMTHHYKEAHAYGGSDSGNCTERFGHLCGHSIWSDVKI